MLADVAKGFGAAYADAYPFVQNAAVRIMDELETTNFKKGIIPVGKLNNTNYSATLKKNPVSFAIAGNASGKMSVKTIFPSENFSAISQKVITLTYLVCSGSRSISFTFREIFLGENTVHKNMCVSAR